MRRKLLSILFLLFLAAPFLTAYVCFKIERRAIRKEVKHQISAGLNKNELVFFKFSKEQQKHDLNWKHSKEFEYKDHMYDIVEKEVHGDTTYFWCWPDHAESRLNKQLENLLAFVLQNDPAQKKQRDQINKLYKSLFYNPQMPWILRSEDNYLSKNTLYLFSEISFISCPGTPPPQIV